MKDVIITKELIQQTIDKVSNRISSAESKLVVDKFILRGLQSQHKELNK